MTAGALAFDQAPPLAVPGRFFLTAPLFGLAASVLLLVFGPAVLESRWLPATLAAVHLVTVGVLTMTMCGAWLQLLPVLADAPIAHPRAASLAVHAPLALGAALLPLGLWTASPLALGASGAVLALALFVFLGVSARALRRSAVRHASTAGMRLALVGLAVTLALGLLALAARLPAGTGLTPPLSLHVGWATVGWVGLLVVSVAYQVVPMFQLTPAYPAPLTRYLVPVLFGLLVVYSIGHRMEAVRWASSGLIALALATFAGTTLWLQARRRRRLPDVGVNYWRLGMLSLLAAAALWLAPLVFPTLARDARLSLLLGALYLAGFAVSVVVGMLYRIVPFLVWLHLHQARIRLAPRRGTDVTDLPNVKQIIPATRMRVQWRVYLAGYVLLLAAVIVPDPFGRVAGALLGIAFGLLGRDLSAAFLLYRRHASS